MAPEKSPEGPAGFSNSGGQTSAEFELQESVGGALKVRSVTVPPRLFAVWQTVDVDVFQLDHFEQAGCAVGASPTACSAAAVRSFCDSEVADRIIDHNGAGAQFSPRSGRGLPPHRTFAPRETASRIRSLMR